mmetsp:Transcript_8618/g.19942  ORF Transcript_8618/g.19942 Transcript_8618/m.19942 type:complete len:109 (+) Transcript_8618:453-779(+)
MFVPSSTHENKLPKTDVSLSRCLHRETIKRKSFYTSAVLFEKQEVLVDRSCSSPDPHTYRVSVHDALSHCDCLRRDGSGDLKRAHNKDILGNKWRDRFSLVWRCLPGS